MQIGKHNIEIKEYLTARDSREINRAMLEGVEFDAQGNASSGFNATMLEKQEDALIRVCVTSFDGEQDAEKILNLVLGMQAGDYQKLLQKLRPLQGLVESN